MNHGFYQKLKEKWKALIKRIKYWFHPSIIPAPEPTSEVFKPSLYIGNDHWKLFSSVIGQAKNEIKIVTNSISANALHLICSNVSDKVDVKIITGRGRCYEDIFKKIGRKNIKRCSYLHAKFCIIDKELLLLGSSNITIGSLGNEKGAFGNLEVDLLTKKKEIINSAEFLFHMLWNEESNIEPLKIDSGFISSAYGIPLQIKDLIIKAEKGITIIVPSFFQMKTNLITIPVYIRKLNSNVQLTIITSHRVREQYYDGLKEIQNFDKTEVILVKDQIHAKIYLFDEKVALISSVNLTFNSWITSLESGILITDKHNIQLIKNQIESFKRDMVPVHIILSIEGGKGLAGSIDNILQKINFKFEPEGLKILPELKGILPSLTVIPSSLRKTTIARAISSHSIIVPSKTPLKPESIKILPELFEQEVLKEKEKEQLVNERENLLLQLFKTFYVEEEKNLEIKKKIININLKLSRLQKLEELSENSKDILNQILLDYVLSCPFTEAEDIIWYFSDFEIENGIILDLNLLFEIFTLAFYTEHKIKTAGSVFKIFSKINIDFKFIFEKSLNNFFKNMILNMGNSGVEIKNYEDFQLVSKEFKESFAISVPLPEEILDAIFKQKKAIKKIILNTLYYNRICNIFKEKVSEIEIFFKPKRETLMKGHLRNMINKLIIAKNCFERNDYIKCCGFSKEAVWDILFAYLSFINKFPTEKFEQSIEKMHEIAFGTKNESFLSKIQSASEDSELQITEIDAKKVLKNALDIYKKIRSSI